MFKTNKSPLTASEIAARLAVCAVMGANALDDGSDADDRARFAAEAKAIAVGLRGSTPDEIAAAAINWCKQGGSYAVVNGVLIGGMN